MSMPRERATATATASAPLEFAVVAGLLVNLAVTAGTLVVTARRQAAGGADVVLTYWATEAAQWLQDARA